jgi:excinuclease ABC subunit A
VLYVLDEPSIGLHPRDNRRCSTRWRRFAIWETQFWSSNTTKKQFAALITSLTLARRRTHGGFVVARGTPDDVAHNSSSVTGSTSAAQRKFPFLTRGVYRMAKRSPFAAPISQPERD